MSSSGLRQFGLDSGTPRVHNSDPFENQVSEVSTEFADQNYQLDGTEWT